MKYRNAAATACFGMPADALQSGDYSTWPQGFRSKASRAIAELDRQTGLTHKVLESYSEMRSLQSPLWAGERSVPVCMVELG